MFKNIVANRNIPVDEEVSLYQELISLLNLLKIWIIKYRY